MTALPPPSEQLPLTQITVRLQGTRGTSRQALAAQLNAVAALVAEGQPSGQLEADHAGYTFRTDIVLDGQSIFADGPSPSSPRPASRCRCSVGELAGVWRRRGAHPWCPGMRVWILSFHDSMRLKTKQAGSACLFCKYFSRKVSAELGQGLVRNEADDFSRCAVASSSLIRVIFDQRSGLKD